MIRGVRGRCRFRQQLGTDRGFATAEFAVVLPAVVLVLVLGVGLLAASTAQLACVQAAHLGARAAARGDSIESVRLITQRAAPPRAAVTIGFGVDPLGVADARVVVRAPLPGPIAAILPRSGLTATAVAEVER